MTRVTLTGQLLCRSQAEAQVVAAHLPRHIELTRAEPGCLRFDVTPTSDPWIWDVTDLFDSADSFEAHQARAAASEWGEQTRGLPRHYAVHSP